MLLQKRIEHMSIVYTCNTYSSVPVIYSGVSGQCSHIIQAYDSWSVWSMFSYNTSVRLVECPVNVLIQYKRTTRGVSGQCSHTIQAYDSNEKREPFHNSPLAVCNHHEHWPIPIQWYLEANLNK